MHPQTTLPDSSISLFVKNVLTLENDENKKTVLPFYADGYPGIMYQVTENGLYVQPQNKEMPLLFLYGQTIHPIELRMDGQYKLIWFQLYPFVIKSFFDVSPQTLNDGCYDLLHLKHFDVPEILTQLSETKNFDAWNEIITALLKNIFQAKSKMIDYKIQQAIQLIIDTNGAEPIKTLREKLRIAERTFERRFLAQVGIKPKQFSKIIQFQNSLNRLQEKDFNKLTDIVYANGFADQSHFIRVFKAFTGSTPKSFNSGGL